VFEEQREGERERERDKGGEWQIGEGEEGTCGDETRGRVGEPPTLG